MKTRWIGLTALAGLVACHASGPAMAQANSDRTIEQFTCKDIMRETGNNRGAAIAFLHGYLLGKSGASKFNLDILQKRTDEFVDRCLDNPQSKAEDIMSAVTK